MVIPEVVESEPLIFKGVEELRGELDAEQLNDVTRSRSAFFRKPCRSGSSRPEPRRLRSVSSTLRAK